MIARRPQHRIAGRRSASPRRQAGTTLIVALLMLLMMMIHALASFNAADAQLRNAGSQQSRQEAQAAAQLAIAGLLGSSAFATAAGTSGASGASGTPGTSGTSQQDVDLAGDGHAVYTVTLEATCTGARRVQSVTIPAQGADDAACLAAATPSGDMPCADTSWNIRARVAPQAAGQQSGVRVEIDQGVDIRLDTSDAIRACPGLPAGTAMPSTPPALSKARRKTYWSMRTGD